ncbi:MAG: metal-dependent hydrolase [Leptolyngbyaceae cyanobacterium SM1_1_3]|nr:metal-dependent hydrolase [Leptolyngbyaceae cyanobacterium SM1_1_3]NJN02812.1 metal-dependent hydrolase [Leptolyngbyaceae cyanobacterium RM1_1_2]
MKGFLRILAIAVALPALVVAAFFLWASAGAYAKSRYAEIVDFGNGVPPEKDTFTLVSYNIGYLSGLTNNVAITRDRALFDTNQSTATAALDHLDADFVALQEVDLDAKRSFNVNQAEAIAKDLKLSYGAIAVNWDKNYVPFPSWPLSAHFGRILSGQAILSRYLITDHERIVLDKVASNPAYYNALYLDRLAQVAFVNVNQQRLVLINVHLEAFNTATRMQQTQYVLALAEKYAATSPVLLVGDFNSAVNREEEGEKSIQQMLKSDRLQPVFAAEEFIDGAIATFPSDRPQFKLDYVFYNPDKIEILEARVATAAAQASDHLPIAVQFRLK